MIPSDEFLKLKLHDSFNTLIFSKVFSRLVSTYRYNICSCKAAGFASGLVFAYKYVEFAVLAFLITYFTDSSKYNLRKAAAFVNIQEGLSASLVIVFIYLSHAYFGRFKIIICSTVFYISGLVLLYLTASHQFPESKSVLLNIIGVVLLAVGEAGVKTFLEAFLADQLRAHEPKAYKNEDRVLARKRVWWLVAWCCSVLTAFILPFNDSWPQLFKISAVVMGSTLILFLAGILVYHCRDLANLASSFTIFRVVKASILKRNLEYPTSPDQLFGNYENQLCLSPQIKILRWLDKAAIIESSNLTSKEQENLGRLCTVTEVQELKLLLKMVPMWTTFLVFGLVVSTGKTFFPEQGNNMDSPNFIIFMLIIPSISNKIRGYLSKSLILKWDPHARRQAQIFRIWLGMALSILCCAVAWRVEVHRLKIVNDKGLLNKSDDLILPMSIFWLAPQFCLLGLMQGLAIDGLNEFLIDQFPESMEDYVTAINEFVIGMGSFLNILCVSANGSLFSSTLNRSRLDKHYKTLTVVSFVNFCYYLFVSTFYTSNEGSVEIDEILPDAV